LHGFPSAVESNVEGKPCNDWFVPVVMDDISVTTIANPFANLEDRALLRLEYIFGTYRLLVPLRYGTYQTLNGTGEGDAGARVLFSVVDRERTITERSLGFVPYGFEECPAGSLTGIIEKSGRLKGVMPSHQVNGRTEHRMAKVKFFEAGKVLD
jgi:hypothetical protein